MVTTRPWIAAPLWLALAAGAAADADRSAVRALREGNRLVREGRLEEAYEAYLHGYRPGEIHPVLAYNVATTAHQLGRLAEAVLWYRRAEAVNPGDPWLRENLTQARSALGLQPYPAPGPSGLVLRHRWPLFLLGALLVALGALLWIFRPRRGARTALVAIAIGAALYLLTHLAVLVAPTPAVVLVECSGETADLPPGSEVWITGSRDERYQIAAGPARLECAPSTIVEIVERP